MENFDTEGEFMKNGNMSNSEELKNKITNWLLEEGFTFSQAVDDNAEFRLRVNFGYVIDVVKEKGRKRLGITASMGFQEERVVKAFKNLTKKPRQEFFDEIRREFTKFPIRIVINPPTLETLDSVYFDDHVYLEDLTKTKFLDSLELVNNSMLFLFYFATKKLDIDLSAPSSASDNKTGAYQ